MSGLLRKKYIFKKLLGQSFSNQICSVWNETRKFCTCCPPKVTSPNLGWSCLVNGGIV